MSQVTLQGNASGTGIFTLAAPNSNTNRTLNLPDAAGTVATTANIPTVASTAEAEAGTNNTNLITPLRMREGFNASGSAPVYACRAWVNFNGTGTVAIRASGNVSSITDNAIGNYTVNFTTAMPDADYGFSVTSGWDGASASNETTAGPIDSGGLTTSSFRFWVTTGGGGARDVSFVSVQIFR
jgi:hypothetical protein